MNILKGYKLVPVEPTEEMLEVLHDRVLISVNSKRREANILNDKAWWAAVVEAAPTPPQPIYDEAAELEKFSAHWKLEGRIYRDKNTKQWLPTRDSIEGFQMAERVHALWLGWESCAQSRAKAGEVGHE